MESGSIRESTLLRTLVAAVGSALLTFVGLAMMAPPSSAWLYQGCRYDPDSINPISYRFFSVASEYETAFKDAEAVWDATAAPGYFTEQSWSWDPEINVIDDEFTGSFWAITAWYCDGDGTYNGNEVTIGFDTVDMEGLNSFEKKLVAEHEIGHAYGLAHVSDGCHVMRTGSVIFTCGTLPSSDDVAGVEEIYSM